VANSDDNNVSVLLGNGDGTFQSAVNYVVGKSPDFVSLSDLNGDGNLDLAVTNQRDSTVSVLLGDGHGGFAPAPGAPAKVGSFPDSVAVGDFNGDGRPDLAVSNSSKNNLNLLLGNGDGTFQAAGTFAVGPSPQSVAVGDFNGDGIPDLVAANSGSNT